MVMVSPFVPPQVATLVSELVNTIGLPEAPPVALTTNGTSPLFFEGRLSKVMVCPAFVTTSSLTTSAAAL